MTYPVARIRSMSWRILRRYALWVGLDRPTPRGSAAVPGEVGSVPIDDMSGVVEKELTDETEDALLRWELGDIVLLGFQPCPFYRQADKDRTRMGSVAV